MGNAVEWYDFAVYGALAPVLATVFFPAAGTAALTATFAVFATSFVARPVGAVLFGRLADRSGRRPVMVAVIVLMSVATAAIGLLPTWSAVGALAPALLLSLRLVQGLSSGGELPSALVFLVESAPAGRRGLFGGWHLGSTALGLFGGYAVVTVLTATLSEAAMAGWGWRTAFLLAAPLGLVGRFVRRRLDETPAYRRLASPGSPRVQDVLRGRGPAIAGALALVAALSLSFNVWFVFLPGYLVTASEVPSSAALLVTLVGLGVAVVVAPAAGAVSDRVGRRPVLVTACAGIAAFAVPGFALAGSGSLLAMAVAGVVMGVLVGSLQVSAFVAEVFPAQVRVTGSGLTYGVGTALVGGTAPVLASLLVQRGADAWVPLYVVLVAGLALLAALRARETAFVELR